MPRFVGFSSAGSSEESSSEMVGSNVRSSRDAAGEPVPPACRPLRRSCRNGSARARTGRAERTSGVTSSNAGSSSRRPGRSSPPTTSTRSTRPTSARPPLSRSASARGRLRRLRSSGAPPSAFSAATVRLVPCSSGVRLSCSCATAATVSAKPSTAPRSSVWVRPRAARAPTASPRVRAGARSSVRRNPSCPSGRRILDSDSTSLEIASRTSGTANRSASSSATKLYARARGITRSPSFPLPALPGSRSMNAAPSNAVRGRRWALASRPIGPASGSMPMTTMAWSPARLTSVTSPTRAPAIRTSAPDTPIVAAFLKFARTVSSPANGFGFT